MRSNLDFGAPFTPHGSMMKRRRPRGSSLPNDGDRAQKKTQTLYFLLHRVVLRFATCGTRSAGYVHYDKPGYLTAKKSFAVVSAMLTSLL